VPPWCGSCKPPSRSRGGGFTLAELEAHAANVEPGAPRSKVCWRLAQTGTSKTMWRATVCCTTRRDWPSARSWTTCSTRVSIPTSRTQTGGVRYIWRRMGVSWLWCMPSWMRGQTALAQHLPEGRTPNPEVWHCSRPPRSSGAERRGGSASARRSGRPGSWEVGAHGYSGRTSPEPPISAGTSFCLTMPSWIRSTVSS